LILGYAKVASEGCAQAGPEHCLSLSWHWILLLLGLPPQAGFV
jgi:hypothetical protein